MKFNIGNLENFIAGLKKLLVKNELSAIIDGAGGPLCSVYSEVIKDGGIISIYGQTADMKGVVFDTNLVRKNIDVGSTMGSRKEFKDKVKLIDEKKIKPIVSHVWNGLNATSIDQAISMMSNGNQFGKLVIEM